MAAEILIEVGLAAAVESLLTAILRAKERAFQFESILSKLEDTLIFLSPKVKNIEQLKKSIDIPTDGIRKLNQRLLNAEEIVNRCSRIGQWNYCRKYRYSKILRGLDASLREIFGAEVQIEIWEDVVTILVKIKEENKKLEKLFETKKSSCISIGNRDGYNVLMFMAYGFKRYFQPVLRLIIPYFSSFFRVRKIGYQRIK